MITLALVATLAVPAVAQAAKPERNLYVSLGDSYAAGYQPTAPGVGRTTRNGLAYQVPGLAKPRGYKLKLVNFGCGGETTVSLVQRTTECGKGLGPGGVKYGGTTQLKAATKYIRAHKKRIALITVSIGGNDVTKCAREADAISCVVAAVGDINANVGTIAKALRKAAGPKPKLVGTTYPDVILGAWVANPPNQALATQSVAAFQQFINPALKKGYAEGKGKFVDVTTATGAYTPLTQTTTLAPYGLIPQAVADVCTLTFYCQFGDIHARTSGYKIIAELVAKALPKRS
jgi:lysophospholipase L1-like esterase